MNVHVAVPDLFWPDAARAHETRGDRLPALEALVARGRRTIGRSPGLEAWLLARWGLADAGPAPYALLADGGDPGEAWWLCAEPCHMRVNLDHLVPLDATHFDLARAEADALVESLNRHFAAAGLGFVPLRPERWYVRSAEPLDAAAPPLAAARGQRLDSPAGRGNAPFNALTNEIQMVLHGHAVNEAREDRGAPPINAVWLWGGGRLQRPPARAFARVRSAGPLAAGLAAASGGAVLPLPDDGVHWLQSAPGEGVELIVLEQLRAPASYGDAATWTQRLAALERDWFAPLRAALRAGRIGMVTLHAVGAGGALDVETTRQDLRFFWRRARPLAAYAATA
ncbi:MAG TPA: regulator [Burkholderiales bacterium]|nr:regulator [Burkholderiales bacterium]